MPRRRGKVIPFPGTTGGPGRSDPPPSSRSHTDERGLVEVHRCDRAEALVVKSLFESERIPTLLRSRLAQSVHPFTVGSQGEVIVLVPEGEVMRARVLLGTIAPGSSPP